MKLQFAMLADTALMGPNNKLVISGADVDNVQAAAYPAVHPIVSLVVTFELEDQDYGRTHTLRVEGVTPHGEPWFPPVESQVTPGPQTRSYPEKSAIVINFTMLVLPTSGDYTFRLYADGKHVRDLPLHAIVVPLPAEQAPKSTQPKVRRDTLRKEQGAR